MNEPIDAVISWVDGYDPVYQDKLKTFCIQNNINKETAIEPTRIQQTNEINYCLRSLDRFTPWIRTIYIITNQQTPPIVNELAGSELGNKIKIIDQNELLMKFDVTSPVFNSLSIEWLIWHIEDLSNHFIYLNDDFIITRNLKPKDFFQENNIILRGEWKTQAKQKIIYKIKNKLLGFIGQKAKLKMDPHRSWQEESARRAGWNKLFYLLPHAPFPLIKKTFNDFIAENPHIFAKNICYPFRDANQISSIPLMVHLDIKHKRVDFDTKYQSITVNGATHSFKKIKARLNKAKKSSHIAFVCMQSIDQAEPKTKEYMLKWLDEQTKSNK